MDAEGNTPVERHTRPRVHDNVVRTLARRILSGEWKQGTYLPSTEELTATLHVSRTALREVYRVLGAKGLLETSPRTGTRVRLGSHWNVLDPELLEWCGDQLQPPLLRDLIEMRNILEPSVAALAAERASAKQIEIVERACDDMAACLPDRYDEWLQADLAFHRGVLDAAGNGMLSQLASAFEATLLASFKLTIGQVEPLDASLALHRAVLDAIRARSRDEARAAMERLLDAAAADLDRAGRL